MVFRTILQGFSCLLITCLPTHPTSAQTSTSTTPFPLSRLLYRLDSAMDKEHVTGMLISIVNKDSILYEGGLGITDLETKKPVDSLTLFRQASITKVFIALGIMQLIHDGRLTLQTRLKDAAPEIPFDNPWEATDPVTIEDLLQHTSGFSDKSPFAEYNFGEPDTSAINTLLVFRRNMRSYWRPGEAGSYSNVNYMILGYLIQRLSGKPLNTYMQEKVFHPLGMPKANILYNEQSEDQYCKSYNWREGRYRYVPHQAQYMPGNGSMNASAADFAHAILAYLNDWRTDSGQFLSPAVLHASETPHNYLSARAGLVNSYGYANDYLPVSGHPFRGHHGAMGGCLSGIFYNRQDGIGYALTINSNNERFYRYAEGLIADFLLQTIPPATISTPVFPFNRSLAQSWSGYYRFSSIGQPMGYFAGLRQTFKLESTDSSLHIHVIGGFSMNWVPADSTGRLYKYPGLSFPHIALVKNKDNQPGIFDNPLYFRKVSAFEAWAPIIAILAVLLLLISSLFFAVQVLIRSAIRRQLPASFLPGICITLTAICLFSIPFMMRHIEELIQDCRPLDGIHAGYLFCLYALTSFALLSVFFLFFKWDQLRSKWTKLWLSLGSASALYCLFILFNNHFFTL